MKARLSMFAAALCVAACSRPVPPAPAASAPPPAGPSSAAGATQGIAWKHADSEADVDAAFALARSENKPVFLYWGATWCPPCNHVKATLFNRQDFIARSRAFVPVYIDGDSRGAQKLGKRFRVRGYPTMVLFSADGVELTRLPGEVDAALYTQVLTLGMNAQRPVKAVLADALAGGARWTALTPGDWRLLAFYSWATDEGRAVPPDELPAALEQLAARCPADQTETASRLLLQALAARDPVLAEMSDDAASRARVLALLADPAAARATMDVLTNAAGHIVEALSTAGSVQRAQLVDAFDLALVRLQADASLSRADRLAALIARVTLARLDAASGVKTVLPGSLLAEVREEAARMDREITDGDERQAVITSAAYMLGLAGLDADADALLEANLAKSHSPYYLMSGLAANARKRGDTTGSLRWSQAAFERAEGPATRLQWGAHYALALIDLSPQDEPRIEKAVRQLFTEAAAQPDAFYERSARSLQLLDSRLQGWNRRGDHAAVMQRLRAQLGGVCRGLPAHDAQRVVCDGLLKENAS